ncbi:MULTISPECIES: hypothetical protein [Prauserella salsuginis group]|uniref:Uncharacterized protein n=1 Tax=Prauserella salsuginis TaxID=387889 RepID=A0ABW6FWW9_9PSEU|nr:MULTISPECIES: hypothetical protein [Prauserella salsuginis group]MCR3720481.1 hypothetical protein [Prauserella flava]MCR3733808.1 hypothetical protein [Prauserella salsuginis]
MRTPGSEADGRAHDDVGPTRADGPTKTRVTSAVAKPAAVATAGLMLAATAGLAAPATAVAETKQVRCGDTVTAAPGDRIQGITALGVPLDLGVVTDTVGSLLSGVCKVTVNVVDTAVRPVPGAGEPVADGVNDAVGDVTRNAKKATDTLGGRDSVVPGPGDDSGEPSEPEPGEDGGGGPDSGSGAGNGSDHGAGNGSGGDEGGTGTREPNSPVVEGNGSGSGSGGSGGASALAAPAAMSPELRYAGIPVARGAMFDAAPGLRYGGQIPGYNPEFGVLGSAGDPGGPATGAGGNAQDTAPEPDGRATGQGQENTDLRTAGDASSLPSAAPEDERGPSIPMLLAVLALAGVSAGLVRTWVIQRASA